MTIFLYPSRTTEGAVYARMLSIELGQAGMNSMDCSEADNEAAGCRLGIRCTLALVDTARQDYEALGASLREAEIPVLFYGYARPAWEAMGYDPDQIRAREREEGALFFQRPVEISELLARCRHLPEEHKADPLYIGRLHKDCAYDGRILHLTPIEHRVLALLHEKKGETVDRQTLYRSCWGASGSTEGGAASNVVDACLRSLRKKLEEPLGRRLLYSVRGVGYRYEDRGADSHEEA